MFYCSVTGCSRQPLLRSQKQIGFHLRTTFEVLLFFPFFFSFLVAVHCKPQPQYMLQDCTQAPVFVNHTHTVQALRMQVSHYRYIHVILPLCHFPLKPNPTQFGNSTWIDSHHCHSCHFHSVRFFQSGELLFVFTATVKHLAALRPDSC